MEFAPNPGEDREFLPLTAEQLDRDSEVLFSSERIEKRLDEMATEALRRAAGNEEIGLETKRIYLERGGWEFATAMRQRMEAESGQEQPNQPLKVSATVGQKTETVRIDEEYLSGTLEALGLEGLLSVERKYKQSHHEGFTDEDQAVLERASQTVIEIYDDVEDTAETWSAVKFRLCQLGFEEENIKLVVLASKAATKHWRSQAVDVGFKVDWRRWIYGWGLDDGSFDKQQQDRSRQFNVIAAKKNKWYDLISLEGDRQLRDFGAMLAHDQIDFAIFNSHTNKLSQIYKKVLPGYGDSQLWLHYFNGLATRDEARYRQLACHNLPKLILEVPEFKTVIFDKWWDLLVDGDHEVAKQALFELNHRLGQIEKQYGQQILSDTEKERLYTAYYSRFRG